MVFAMTSNECITLQQDLSLTEEHFRVLDSETVTKLQALGYLDEPD